MRKGIALASLLLVGFSVILCGCGEKAESSSDKPVGNIAPDATGGPKGGGAPVAGPAPEAPPK